ncbi:hypothetical protein [Bacillus toyonensis]|uniref:hypothetical protein n=1 Tax=Bacillus toyonensis TaxID=155322 RepID=UPI000BEC59D7|nr:hypothetical protein [Bacillus toyonensis]PEC65014.1 hypothetical protein CON62_23845 [Bacillus toyonensis]
MPNPIKLLNVVQTHFNVTIDIDSNGGQILNSLMTTESPTVDKGIAVVDNLTFSLTSKGISVHTVQSEDALVFNLPVGTTLEYRLVAPDSTHPYSRVELKLVPLSVTIPFLRPAKISGGMLQRDENLNNVQIQFPDLLLVVTVSENSSATLAPSQDPTGSQVVTMNPAYAFFGPGTTLGFGFQELDLNLTGPGEPEIKVSIAEVYVAPPGIPALAMNGSGKELYLGLGGGGLSGKFNLSLSDASAPLRPEFLKNMETNVHLKHNIVILIELKGEIDLSGELRSRIHLQENQPNIDYVMNLNLDGGWQAALSLSSSGGKSYLWRTQATDPNARDFARDTLGAYAVFSPILVSNLPDPKPSGYVDLALGIGAAGGLAASKLISTQSITLYGGELRVHDPNGKNPEAFLFFDLETEINLNVMVGNEKLLATRRPLKVRHKAIGLRLDFESGSPLQLHPVFDPAQGFSLDLSDPGLFDIIPGGLGDIVQPERARIAREKQSNKSSLNFEVDLVLSADLGVVTVDRSSIRVPLVPSKLPPTITALGVHIDVPGALSGGGYLKLLPKGGFSGSFDVSLPSPLGLRVAAGLSIEKAFDQESQKQVTAVLSTFDLEMPVPIPIANSGLGLFGFLGLFAMHYMRNQSDTETALDWYKNAKGNATDIEQWKVKANAWALGLGAVIGTVEGGFLVNAKGMIVIELPGPSFLIIMNASILEQRPPTKTKPGEPLKTGDYLATIEIRPKDFLRMGILINYETIKPLLEVRVPAETYFDFQDTSNWNLDVGKISAMASVKFLDVLRADGYLEIHGNGINHVPPGPLSGFSVAAGVRAAFTWGPKDIGLFLKVAAQADVGISFKPLLIIGDMSLRGELHLFIVSIEVAAAAKVIISPPDGFFISANVCGSVDFSFFEVDGCVTLQLGSEPSKPKAEPLVRALSLHSRSLQVLLQGSGVDRPVDGCLGEAASDGGGHLPVVPIDAIPVLQMEMRPNVVSGCKFFNETILSPNLPMPDGWVRRGKRFYRYIVKSIQLDGIDADRNPLNPVVEEGDTPTVWWDRSSNSDDDTDVQLALLNWIPDPTPAAAERNTSLDKRICSRWGDVCAEVAAPASVLWTFLQSAAGRSMAGWKLQGLAWPDALGTFRSSQPDVRLQVTEPWRSGNTLADALVKVTPAYVFPMERHPGRFLVAPTTGLELKPIVPDDLQLSNLIQALQLKKFDGLADAIRLKGSGLRAVRLLLYVNHALTEVGVLVVRALDAAGEKIIDHEIDLRHANWIQYVDDLPKKWNDPTGPWKSLTEWVSGWLFRKNEPHLVLVEADLPEGTAQIEVGLKADYQTEGEDPKWALLIIEGTPEAEMQRYRFDNETRNQQINIVNGALGTDPGKVALLRPNATYSVSITYDVEVANDDGHGSPIKDDTLTEVEKSQRFSFKTDNNPPKRLDPWILATDPGPDQNLFFYGDLLRVVFATNATRKLFEAYKRKLFAVVKAASGRDPQKEKGKFDGSKVKLGTSVIKPVGITPVVMTPFESALRKALPKLQNGVESCIDSSQQTNWHEVVTLKMKLEPLTNYILDLEAHPTFGHSSYPLFRRNFSTSRYENLMAFAADLNQTLVVHRRVANAAPITGLAAKSLGTMTLQIHDQDFEDALREVRWGDLALPRKPRLTVIWQDGVGSMPPQPIGMLIETTESLWRWRDVPQEVNDENGNYQYQLQPQPWLDVFETPIDGPVVSRLVFSTGGCRTLIIFNSTARGGTLSLSLRRYHHMLFEGNNSVETAALQVVSLAKAPWEV